MLSTSGPGYAGVVTSLVGKDVQNNAIPEKMRNTFLVDDDMKGVTPLVLDAGTYYLNPYQVSVFEVSLQSQRFEMSGDDAISFLTVDGFTVNVEGTIEFSLKRDQVSLLTHRVGDMEDIITKVILPRARGFSRIEGSKHPAVNYIIGETRQQFEDRLEEHLQKTCNPWGVQVQSVLIRNIIPPDAIARVIRDREVAVQDSKKFEQQIVEAKSRAELVKQEKLAIQNKEKVEAETGKLVATIQAERSMAVKILDAEKDLSVAKIANQAADFEVQAMLFEAEAARNVIALQNSADAKVIDTEVKAFKGGIHWARHHFYRKVAPNIEKILSGDDAGNLGALFQSFLPGSHGQEALK